MSEKVNGKTVFSLFEVTKSIQKAIAERYKNSYWIKAEMNKLNFYNQSGHCYPELVEKQSGKVIAQVKATLWKEDYININNTFKRILKEPLKDGIKILFLASISFDPVHGLAIRIIDIDPGYTLGDLEVEKQETIMKLQDGGIFNKNKTLTLPLLPQRIAIISVETSKGYVDFTKVLAGNSWGYTFFHLLFPSVLQGEKAIGGIIKQLSRIKKVKSHFDVVAIVRGGGGDIGLSCYNNYMLAKEIASFPIPVITGIGHATNETVSEMIAFSNAITPTKLAEYLLQKFHNFSVPVQKAEEKIIDKSRRLISDEKKKFGTEVKLFRSVTENIILHNRNEIKHQVQSLFQQSGFRFKNQRDILFHIGSGIRKFTYNIFTGSDQKIKHFAILIKKDVGTNLNAAKLLINQNGKQVLRGSTVLIRSAKKNMMLLQEKFPDKTISVLKANKHELNNIEKNIHNMDPKSVLKRGYSITLHNGKAVRSINELAEGDNLNTVLYEGNVISIIKSLNKKQVHE